MTALISGKHLVEEIDGVRCTIIESGLKASRLQFLEQLLQRNGLETKVTEVSAKVPEDGVSYKLGVTDLVFNPMIAVYQKRLKRPDGKVVTPAYWRQEDEQTDVPYWQVRR